MPCCSKKPRSLATYTYEKALPFVGTEILSGRSWPLAAADGLAVEDALAAGLATVEATDAPAEADDDGAPVVVAGAGAALPPQLASTRAASAPEIALRAMRRPPRGSKIGS